MPEEVSGTFHPQVDLKDDAVDRSRYERFYSVRISKVFEDVLESPVEWGAFESTFACEVEATNSRHISKNISKSSKILDYTRRAHVRCDVSNAFHERTCKHECKRKSYESSERRFNHPSVRKNYEPKE